jgi:hypothetical protein
MNPYRPNYLEDGLLTGNGGNWAWFRLGTHPYDLLSEEQRLTLLSQATRLLEGLGDAEAHLLVLPRVYPAEAQMDALDYRTRHPQPGWHPYLEQLTAHVAGQRLEQREVYLGVVLPERVESLRARLWNMGRPRDVDLFWMRKSVEGVLRKLLAPGVGVRLAAASELRWMIQRAQIRGLVENIELPEPANRPAAGGELLSLLEGVVENGHRSLCLVAGRRRSYLSTLTFAFMPDELGFPGNAEWLSRLGELPFPVEASVRFQVVPPRAAAKDVERTVLAAEDMRKHTEELGIDPPQDVQEALVVGQQLQHELTRHQQRMVYAWPRLLVAAGTEEELEERVGVVMAMFSDMGMELAQPAGDQLSLFLEAMPGDRVRAVGARRKDGRWKGGAYEQRMGTATLAGTMWGASGDLGDSEGCPIGYTLGASRNLVQFDPMRAARTDRPTAVAYTGTLGSGKSLAAGMKTYQARLRGATGVVIDPAARTEGGGGWERLVALPGLGKVQSIQLDQSYAGLLDPWRIERDPDKASLLAMDLLMSFLPATEATRDLEVEITAAAADEGRSGQPSMGGLVSRLAFSEDARTRRAAVALDAMGRMPLARMVFSREPGRELRLDGALTLFQFDGLNLPAATARREDYTIEQRLAVGLMLAITALASQLVKSGGPQQEKLLVIDEAWVLTGNARAQRMIEEAVRAGRKHNMAVLLISQSAFDFADERIRNCLGAILAFASQSEAELVEVCRLLGVEPSADLISAARAFEAGDCLFRDLDGRVGRMHIDPTPELLTVLGTTPVDRSTERENVA